MNEQPSATVHIPTAGERSAHCHDCPFFDVIQGQTSEGDTVPPTWGGICRADAPSRAMLQPNAADSAGISVAGRAIWPMVATGDFCGRHPLRAAAYAEAVTELTKVVREASRADKDARAKAMRQADRNLRR